MPSAPNRDNDQKSEAPISKTKRQFGVKKKGCYESSPYNKALK